MNLKKLVLLASCLFPMTLTADIVGTPIPTTNATVILSFSVAPVTGADLYSLKYYRNDVFVQAVLVDQVDFPIDNAFVQTIGGNANGDILCVRVSASNEGGMTAEDNQCVTVVLPAIPSQPLIAGLTIL